MTVGDAPTPAHTFYITHSIIYWVSPFAQVISEKSSHVGRTLSTAIFEYKEYLMCFHVNTNG